MVFFPLIKKPPFACRVITVETSNWMLDRWLYITSEGVVGLKPATLQLAVECFNHMATSHPCMYRTIRSHIMYCTIFVLANAKNCYVVVVRQWTKMIHYICTDTIHWFAIMPEYTYPYTSFFFYFLFLSFFLSLSLFYFFIFFIFYFLFFKCRTDNLFLDSCIPVELSLIVTREKRSLFVCEAYMDTVRGPSRRLIDATTYQ